MGRPGRLIALLLLLVAGSGIGIAARQPSVNTLQTRMEAAESSALKAQADAAAKKAQLDQLTADQTKIKTTIDGTNAQLDSLRADAIAKASQLEGLQRQLAQLSDQLNRQPAPPDLGDLAAKLKADRILLVEQRKDTPEDKDEAQRLWSNIRSVSAQSDAALPQKVDQITRSLPVYYAWRAKNFSNSQEAQLSYVLTGAAAYQTAIDTFWNAVNLVVIDRLDAISRIAGGTK